MNGVFNLGFLKAQAYRTIRRENESALSQRGGPLIWLGLLLTERCNVSCRHCFLQGGQRSMSVRQAVDYINGTADLAATSGEEFKVSFTGGEIFLDFPSLLRVTSHARERGVSNISYVTNGFWGHPRSAARQMARELRRAGGTAIFFSMDDYHQEHVPFDVVKDALDACGEAGFAVGIKCVIGRGTKRLAGIMADLGDLTLKYDLIVSESPRVPVPGILNSLDPDLRFRRGIPRGKCPSPPILNIWPDGTVFGCAGAGAIKRLVIGNTRANGVAELWQRLKGNPLLGALAEKGPGWFLPYFTGMGIELPRRRFVSECDLCHVLLDAPEAEKVFQRALYDWRKERVMRIIGAVQRER